MHAVNQLTPEILIVICIGAIAFVVIMKIIFRKKR